MTDNTEINEIALEEETNVDTPEQEETLNPEPVFQEPELIPNPWDDAPENVLFYSEIIDGKLESFTANPEKAYRKGWLDNQISLSDVEFSDIDDWPYLKDKCPHKTQEMILSETRLQKLSELKTKSLQALDTAYVLSSLGFKVDANTTAVRDLEGLVIIGADTVMFCDFDNEFHPLNKEQVLTLQREVLLNGQNLYAQKWSFRKRINEAETVEAINAIEIHFDMLSFQE